MCTAPRTPEYHWCSVRHRSGSIPDPNHRLSFCQVLLVLLVLVLSGTSLDSKKEAGLLFFCELGDSCPVRDLFAPHSSLWPITCTQPGLVQAQLPCLWSLAQDEGAKVCFPGSPVPGTQGYAPPGGLAPDQEDGVVPHAPHTPRKDTGLHSWRLAQDLAEGGVPHADPLEGDPACVLRRALPSAVEMGVHRPVLTLPVGPALSCSVGTSCPSADPAGLSRVKVCSRPSPCFTDPHSPPVAHSSPGGPHALSAPNPAPHTLPS